MTEVVPFKSPFSCPDFCLEHVRSMLAESKVAFDHPHFRDRLKERDLTMRQVLATIGKGEIIDGPKVDGHGDWRIKMKRYVAGRKVQVVMAVNTAKCVVVTVI